MIDLKRAILTMLEEHSVSFTMKPIDFPFSERLMMAIVMPANDDSLRDIEFYKAKDATTDTAISVLEYSINPLEPTSRDRTNLISTRHYELADQREYNALDEYLKERCSGKRMIVEFHASDSLDYEWA